MSAPEKPPLVPLWVSVGTIVAGIALAFCSDRDTSSIELITPEFECHPCCDNGIDPPCVSRPVGDFREC